MKRLTTLILTTLCIIIISGCKPQQSSSITIGIIEPLEHAAINEIVKGFSESLQKIYHKPVIIKVENAQNDLNLERAIIQKMIDANYTMIVPIGTGATQMSLAMTRNQPVISLASDLSEQDRKKLKKCHATAVQDEISPTQLVTFIHTVYPRLTQLTLIHSSAEKIFPDVEKTIVAGKVNGITIHPIMVSSLPELYSAANALPSQTQGIFILKDNLIASGINTLTNIASKKHIPLITSDQGSVQSGAGFALGVYEKEIGIEGAKLASAVLEGKLICDLPIVDMKKLTVFVNQKALQQEGQEIKPILETAKQFAYTIKLI